MHKTSFGGKTINGDSTNNLTKEVKLIEGRLNKEEVLNILNNVMDVKINFHKLQRLSKKSVDIADENMFDNTRILELVSDKNKVKDFFTCD